MSQTFRYAAVDPAGRRVRGSEQSSSAESLSAELQRKGLLVLDVRQDVPQAAGMGGGRKVVLEATRAMASLLGAGVPLTRALRISAHVATPQVAGVLAGVLAEVERGEALAGALARHPRLFPPIYTGMVRAGERSGALTDAFSRLALHLEREEELRSRLLSAMIYPLVLAGMGGIAVLVLVLVVLPRFVELLEGSGAGLPASTSLLLGISGFVRGWWPILLITVLALGAGAVTSRRSERGRRAGSALLLALPGVGTLRRQVLASRFGRLLGVLLSGGARLLPALDDAHASLDDPLVRDAVARIRGRVREGAPLNAAVAAEQIFPPLLAQLVAVGEEAGQLSTFLLKAAEIFENGSERAVRRLVTFAEPAMIVLFGGVVAFVALSLLQAIYGINADAFR